MKLEQLYNQLYGFFCGFHPYQNLLHEEWLSLKDLHSDLRKSIYYIKGKTLDVGCGEKPYANWFSKVTEYLGLDIGNNQVADYLVEEFQTWPLSNLAFDSVVSFQTFEHIKDLELVKKEINRVLKPHGFLCLSMPFIAYEHGAPSDYRRASQFGITQFFPEYTIIKMLPEGGFGSTVGTLFLRMIRISMKKTKVTQWLWFILLPGWIILTVVINVLGWLLDKLDRTGNFYNNVFLIARKPK